MMALQPMGTVTTLYKFFGAHPERPGLKGFNDECKALDAEEKLDLARLAAVAMGMTQNDVTFPMI